MNNLPSVLRDTDGWLLVSYKSSEDLCDAFRLCETTGPVGLLSYIVIHVQHSNSILLKKLLAI